VTISHFGKHTHLDEMLAEATVRLVEDFEVERAEVWLWDETSHTGYLTHFSGAEANHRYDYISSETGPLGRSAESRRPLFNVPLTETRERADFVSPAPLAHLTAFPLVSENRLVAILGLYCRQAAPEDLIEWWTMFADITAIASERVLTAAESHKQIQHLSLLFEATRLLNSTLDLAELLELILRIARTEVRADRGSVFLVDKQSRELWSIVAQGLESQEIRVPFGKGVAGHVAESGEPVNVEDAYQLAFFDSSYDQKLGYTTHSLLCMPIRHRNGEVVGVIQLLNEPSGRFSKKDEEFLESLSGHMAMALENARLHREALERQRQERDLAVARQIQRSLLPSTVPVLPGFEIAVDCHPCYECGGDYYDFLSLGHHTLLLVLADVEGKGVGSALVMSSLQATLRALSLHMHSLELLISSLNEMIFKDIRSNKYLSCFLGLIDTRRRSLHYINAGHCPPLLLPAGGGSPQHLTAGGTVVGLFEEPTYERGSIQLQPGDLILGYTDGVTATLGKDGGSYGTDRLVADAERLRHLPADKIVEGVLERVSEFSQSRQPEDDRILMAVKITADGGDLQLTAS
jgi:sigma-B regulation protein RsbU (phosphoserine phosphatase)